MDGSADRYPFDPADPRSYDLWTRDVIRWGDLDSLGHVNNAMFARFFESGRIRLFEHWGLEDRAAGTDFYLVRLLINFRTQLHYPGEAHTGTRVLRAGRSSLTLAQAIFQDQVCAASGEAVVVHVDLASSRAIPLPDDIRARLSDESR